MLYAQEPKDFVIPIKITTNDTRPSIILSWPGNGDARSYTIRRKTVSDNSYLSSFASVGFVDNTQSVQTSFEDTTIQAGILYEYEISGNFTPAIPDTRNVYICAGINIPAVHKRGSILLLCDSSVINDIETDLSTLYFDLVGDGWKVRRINVDRQNTPVNIKAKITDVYNTDPDLKQVLIIGHVPVPYSGNIDPDGHTNHIGCWPSDGYYGSMNSNWTDTSTSYSVSNTRPENINLPGDGKFDQSYLPTVQLAVGRIDFYNLPSFEINETGLLSKYLKKNHRFRIKEINPLKRALVEDNFLSYTEKFSQSAWKSYSALVGYDNITIGQYETDLQDENGYLWSYGNGGGTYTGAGGIGNTFTFVINTYRTVFTQLFGSYFGDWDNQDNYMRACLASGGQTLTCVWGGRPHWYFHHMSAGLPMGYSELLTMNNGGLYANTGYGPKMVHIGLLGDPSLRSSYVKPVTGFDAITNASTVNLMWAAAHELDITGYYIYRSNSIDSSFTLLNETPITDTYYNDVAPLAGNNVYMVRAVKKEEFVTNSAYSNNSAYFNLSQGVFDSVSITKVYRFTGNGNWDNANNWLNNTIPPSVLPHDSEIIISPAEGGLCILNVPQIISHAAKITVESNQHFIIMGKLTIQ